MGKTPLLLSALAVTMALALPLAQAKGGSKAVDYRQSIMSIYKWNLDPMVAMVKGDQPFDQARFAALAKDLHRASQLDLPGGFPKGSDEGDTDARPEVWSDGDGFKSQFGNFQQAAAALATAAEGGDLEAIKPKFGEVGKACKGCHDKYRAD
jgi:cytochrome c556